MLNELVPIESAEGVTLYGRVISAGGKLGQYEVYNQNRGTSGPFHTYKEAETQYTGIVNNIRNSKKERQ
jgi:hypothetical protein